MFIYSAHDSTLVPILCALGIYDDHWPDYASSILIEFASLSIENSHESYPSESKEIGEENCSNLLGNKFQYYIRVIFNGQSIEIVDHELEEDKEKNIFEHEEKFLKSHWIPLNSFLDKILLLKKEMNEINEREKKSNENDNDMGQFQATIGV